MRSLTKYGLLLLAILFPGPALGHGDAAWIMQNAKTKFCCGPKDCVMLEGVRYGVRGWSFPNPHTGEMMLVPFDWIYRFDSNDHHHWGCFKLGEREKPIRCFFSPNPGT